MPNLSSVIGQKLARQREAKENKNNEEHLELLFINKRLLKRKNHKNIVLAESRY